MYGKRGKDSPNFGKKIVRCDDYIPTYFPNLVEYIKTLDTGSKVTQADWRRWAKENGKIIEPWSNLVDNNPWKGTGGFARYYSDTLQYCNDKDISIPKSVSFGDGRSRK